jgi:tetratricopeptide (TPR) repeat protein
MTEPAKLTEGEKISAAAQEIAGWKAPNADEIYAVQRMDAIGRAAMAVSDFRLAAKMFDELTKLAPTRENYASLGEALGRQGKYDEAKIAFEGALRVDPNFMPAWFNMAVMYDLAFKHEEAERCYAKSIEIQETPAARNNLANQQRALLKLELAEANYRRAVEIGYPGAQMNLSLLLMMKGDYVKGIPMFEMREEFGSEAAYGPAREMLRILRTTPP